MNSRLILKNSKNYIKTFKIRLTLYVKRHIYKHRKSLVYYLD